jgi:hypothetical protein
MVLTLFAAPIVYAAPTGKMDFVGPEGSTAINVLRTGEQEQLSVVFMNDAGAAITDVPSTLQYIKLAAVNLNPDKVEIGTTAQWSIYTPGTPPVARVSGSATASIDSSAIYSPFSTTQAVTEYD